MRIKINFSKKILFKKGTDIFLATDDGKKVTTSGPYHIFKFDEERNCYVAGTKASKNLIHFEAPCSIVLLGVKRMKAKKVMFDGNAITVVAECL